jgi:methyltransferase-like protein
MVVLSEAWPGTLPFAELCSRARIRLGVPRLNDPAAATVDAQLLGADLLAIYTSMTCSRCVELTPRPLRLAARPGERPRATPLARWQATAGTSAANLRHQNVPLGKLHRQVLRCLDGAHDRAALVEATEALVAQGAFVIRRQNESVSEPEAVRQVLRHDIEVALNELAASSFLME